MEIKDMMILGGCGDAGALITELLLQETNLNIIVADRDSTKVKKVAEKFNSSFDGNRVRGIKVDASNYEELKEALKGCDMILSCVPITSSGIKDGIVRAAFDAGVNYMDLCFDNDKRKLLKDLENDIKSSGKYFITEGGFMPGVPSMMAFLAAKHLDSLYSVEFSGMLKDNNAAYGSVVELIIQAAEPVYGCKGGVWKEIPKTASKKFDFGPELGKKTCYPMDQYELRCLPKDLGLEEVGFYSSGVNPVTDLILFPLIATGLYNVDWIRELGVKLIINTIRKYTKPPFITRVSMEAKGKNNEKLKVTIEHKDAYIGTAVATVAGVLQILDGTMKEPGVLIMGHHVEPDRYIADIKRLGMNVEIERIAESREYRNEKA